MKLEGKKALVTGASRGIGRAIALALAAEGADVVVNYAGSEAAAKEVAAEIEAMGRKAFVVQADISSNEAATANIWNGKLPSLPQIRLVPARLLERLYATITPTPVRT